MQSEERDILEANNYIIVYHYATQPPSERGSGLLRVKTLSFSVKMHSNIREKIRVEQVLYPIIMGYILPLSPRPMSVKNFLIRLFAYFCQPQ